MIEGRDSDYTEEFREETDQLLVQRLRVGLWLILLAMPVYGVVHTYVYPDLIATLYALTAIQIGIVLTLLLVLRLRPSGRWPVAVGILTAAGVYTTTAVMGIVTGDVATTPLVVVVLVISSASLLPWGLAPHLAALGMATVAILWNLYAVEGYFPIIYTYAAAAIGFVWAGSVFLRHELERNRRAMARETLERHRAEEDLRRSEERFALAVNGANDGLWDWDLRSNEMYFSPRWKAILGFGKEEIRPHPDEWLLKAHPEDAERMLVELQAHIDGQISHYENEHRLQHKNGTYRWVLARGLLDRDDSGRPRRMAGSLTDITNRKEVEERLLQTTAESQAILRALPDWYFRLHSDGTILDYHAPLLPEAHAGGNLLGKRLHEALFPEDMARRFEAAIHEVVERIELRSIEYSVPSAAGERYYEARLVPLRRTQIIVIIRDITERKQVAKALASQTAELARSNAELQQFAYVASHDLQEPLRMVASYVQLLARRYEGQLDEDADEFIRYAVDGASTMQTLINDLLSYSRVGTRGKQLEPTACGAVIERALANLQAAITEEHASITHDPLPTVLADATQMVQVFQNLIGNAIKFHDVEPPRIHVAARAHDGEWVFSVRDNGIGIDTKYGERIFAIFQRLHSKRDYSGTGIGLAICKKIVERHGGRIWVDSLPKKGSTFYFTLPVTKREEAADDDTTNRTTD